MGLGKVRDYYDQGHPALHGQELRAQNEELPLSRGHADCIVQDPRRSKSVDQEEVGRSPPCRNREGKER